jgi:6-phosphogluconate dehydrogenase
MSDDKFGWVDRKEAAMKEEKSKDYFSIVEGKQQFVLLTHFAPLAQVFDPATKKYRAAEDGDQNVSVKGVCYVWQDGCIKQAKMPYTVVKAIRELRDDPEWEFAFPFPHAITLSATNAGTKEVEYGITPSPKKVEIPQSVMDELAKKWTPEQVVEKIKEKGSSPSSAPAAAPKVEYPTEDINPEDIPFS